MIRRNSHNASSKYGACIASCLIRVRPVRLHHLSRPSASTPNSTQLGCQLTSRDAEPDKFTSNESVTYRCEPVTESSASATCSALGSSPWLDISCSSMLSPASYIKKSCVWGHVRIVCTESDEIAVGAELVRRSDLPPAATTSHGVQLHPIAVGVLFGEGLTHIEAQA